jgi:hypothetical protein
MNNHIEDLLNHPPIDGSSVPGDQDQAIRYAHRCEQRHYEDQRKMMNAQVRLNALAEVCQAGHYPEMEGWLSEIAESLR